MNTNVISLEETRRMVNPAKAAIQEKILNKGTALGERLISHFKILKEEFPIIGDVRGLGPMTCLELVKDRKTKEPAPEDAKAITDYCFKNGLILLACGCYGNVLRFMMPLVTPDEQVDRGMKILKQAFASLLNS